MTDHQMRRYSRQILLPEVGGRGQSSLMDAHIILQGCGSIGAPLALHLAAAGIGRLSLFEKDHPVTPAWQRASGLEATSEHPFPSRRACLAEALGRHFNPDLDVTLVDSDTLSKDGTLFSSPSIVVFADALPDSPPHVLRVLNAQKACKAVVLATVEQGKGVLNVGSIPHNSVDEEGGCVWCALSSIRRASHHHESSFSVTQLNTLSLLDSITSGILATMAAGEILRCLIADASRSLPTGHLTTALLFDALTGEERAVSVETAADCLLCGDRG
ncbi:MAG: ThiF family adenylyltransferase [Magnetococcales bacterium]|nr:ThiF family adenylyltransferase [Magnetococcales bacterium]